MVRIVTQIELRKTVKTSHFYASNLLSNSMADCRAIVDVLATMASDENMISMIISFKWTPGSILVKVNRGQEVVVPTMGTTRTCFPDN